jgi:glycosyltransferase involved in cell wall biosynthesis
MIHGKGLTVLVNAFIELVKRNRFPQIKLKVGGAFTPVDEKYVADLKARLDSAGCLGRVEFLPNLDFTEKMHFFRDLTVFSVPAIYGEAFGLYVIEALASGVPVVQPDSGAFPELIRETQGGLICRADDAVSLADDLERVIGDPELREKLSLRGMNSVRQSYQAGAMAARFEELMGSMAS